MSLRDFRWFEIIVNKSVADKKTRNVTPCTPVIGKYPANGLSGNWLYPYDSHGKPVNIKLLSHSTNVNRAGRTIIDIRWLTHARGRKNMDKNKQNSSVENAASIVGICPKIFRLINIQCTPPRKKPKPKRMLDVKSVRECWCRYKNNNIVSTGTI